MAAWIKQFNVELTSYNPETDDGSILAMKGNYNAHIIKIAVTENFVPLNLSGATATGYFIRADGTIITISGSISNNVISYTLNDNCYTAEGQCRFIAMLKHSGALITVGSYYMFVDCLPGSSESGGGFDPTPTPTVNVSTGTFNGPSGSNYTNVNCGFVPDIVILKFGNNTWNSYRDENSKTYQTFLSYKMDSAVSGLVFASGFTGTSSSPTSIEGYVGTGVTNGFKAGLFKTYNANGNASSYTGSITYWAYSF